MRVKARGILAEDGRERVRFLIRPEEADRTTLIELLFTVASPGVSVGSRN